MEIAIRNYVAASYLLSQEPNVWDAIVILDRGLTTTEFLDDNSCRHLTLQFDDVTIETKDKRKPTLRDIESAIEFAESSSKLLVTCRAGQARSAATAFLVCSKYDGADSAYELLNPKRHSPNELVMSLGLGYLESPEAQDSYRKWKSEFGHFKLYDFIDEIEREFDEIEALGGRNLIAT